MDNKIAESAGQIANSPYRMQHYRGLHNFVEPGEQIPLFAGPCFYCGKGHIHALPHFCNHCGRRLNTLIVVPEFFLRSTRRFILYWNWKMFLYDLRMTLPLMVMDSIASIARDKR